jgi:NADPH:quinone reductase-like Zn-dependent oxidoreductase
MAHCNYRPAVVPIFVPRAGAKGPAPVGLEEPGGERLRVAGIEQFGGALKTLVLPDPRTPREGEVLIEVRAAGVGNWDEIVRTGDWDVGGTPPMALGVEAAGVVAAVGTGAGNWSLGDEVLTHPVPLAGQGTWAPLLTAQATHLARKPADVSWAHAGPFPVPALTAIQVLDDYLRLRPGEQLLVNGAGSVTGGLIVSLAVHREVHVLATAGPASRGRVIRAGAATVVDYHDPEWPAQILDATGGRGVDAAANAAQSGVAEALATVREGGRLATITSDPPEPERGIDVVSVYVRSVASQLEVASRALAAGRLVFELGARFPLTEADAALEHANAGLGGAVVLEL